MCLRVSLLLVRGDNVFQCDQRETPVMSCKFRNLNAAIAANVNQCILVLYGWAPPERG